MIAGLCRPPPVTSQRRGGAGKARRGDRGHGERHQCRRAVRGRQRVDAAGRQRAGEIQPIERFRRRAREIRMRHQTAEHAPDRPCRSRPARRRGRTPGRYAASPNRPAARCRVRYRTRSARVLADPGDVGDAADIQHRQRARQIARQRRVVDRGQRRALPARRHIGRAEIVGDRQAGCAGQPRRRRRSARCGAGPADAGWSGRESRSGRPAAPALSRPGRDTRSAGPRRWPGRVVGAGRGRGRESPADRAAARRRKGCVRVGPKRSTDSPSVSSQAASTPSSDVPLISPIVRGMFLSRPRPGNQRRITPARVP